MVYAAGYHWYDLPPLGPFMKQGNPNGRNGTVTVCARRTDGAMPERLPASGARTSPWDADAGALGCAAREIANPDTRRTASVDPADLAPVKAASESLSAPFGKTDNVVSVGLYGWSRDKVGA